MNEVSKEIQTCFINGMQLDHIMKHCIHKFKITDKWLFLDYFEEAFGIGVCIELRRYSETWRLDYEHGRLNIPEVEYAIEIIRDVEEWIPDIQPELYGWILTLKKKIISIEERTNALLAKSELWETLPESSWNKIQWELKGLTLDNTRNLTAATMARVWNQRLKAGELP